MKKILILIVLLLLLLGGKAFAQEKSRGIIPDYINLQFAGNIGALSAGAGYYLNPANSLALDAIYGFSPAYRTGKAIHNIVVRLNYSPYNIGLNDALNLKPFASLAISRQIADGDRTFERLPKNFPEGYYAPNAFRLHFDLGLSLHKKFAPEKRVRGMEFYLATTTNEMYVTYFINSREVGLGDIFSLTLGIKMILFE
ncbi:MAG TPA: hypothetical protein PKV88_07085 [Bacteroidales bacterium]|jgi:hypothetical protein|nr:hypothetical protein [Bacteroidales bacterium]MDD4085922.1 hypothetical protein [Bacteroidales bacterium]MDY0086172.1 hypothetical protein [Bacteroidales bacterium]HPE43829.1 hypothetical protein [Bacteroidales bacterium]